jgi:membrane protease YdiL (CAAX protease family)
MLRAIIYLIGIVIAEIASVALPSIDTRFVILGLALYFILLVVMIIDAARMDRYHQGQLVLTLTLVPLTRIFSLVLPLMDIPQILWYPAIYLPLLVAAIVVARMLGYKPQDIGLTLRSWRIQLLIPLLGLGLGYIEYSILRPEPLLEGLTWGNAWLPAILLFISTGLVEELIFRGVMQKSSTDMFGTPGIIYASILFAILHVGWAVGENIPASAWLDIVFVFAVALIFGWIVKKSGSLLGVILCHGVINVVLFIVGPLLFTA